MDYGKPTTISANGTVVCMPRPGALHRVTLNFKGATGNTLTLYDSAAAPAGSVLAIIDVVNMPVGTLHYGVQVQNGVVAVMSNGTPGNVTVVTD